jgi:pyruvate dehydrogenase E2 component (dihydrolipoamide acetyltransferase)
MMTKVPIPKVNTNIEEVTITAWLKKEGDRVRKGDPLVEVTTEKAAMEIESPASGTLRRRLAMEKSTLPVGYVIAIVGDEAEPVPDVTKMNHDLLERYRQRSAAGRSGKTPKIDIAPRTVVRATPAARRLAREKGIDLSSVMSSIKEDVITEDGLRQYLTKVNG